MNGAPNAGDMLNLQSIGHEFGGFEVLKDVTFGVRKKTITGLIGPNGSGKTTCFNIISGFLKPKVGTVMFQGEPITGAQPSRLCEAGLVRTFQAPKIFHALSVLENVMVGQYSRTRASYFAGMVSTPGSRRELARMRDRAAEICAKFNLSDLDRPASELPAGQQHILEIARAYASSPSLLMLDEPSSGLNSGEVDVLRSWIRQLAQEGVTIFLVSHDMSLMAEASIVHALQFGRIIATGSMEEIRKDPMVREAYLGS